MMSRMACSCAAFTTLLSACLLASASFHVANPRAMCVSFAWPLTCDIMTKSSPYASIALFILFHRSLWSFHTERGRFPSASLSYPICTAMLSVRYSVGMGAHRITLRKHLSSALSELWHGPSALEEKLCVCVLMPIVGTLSCSGKFSAWIWACTITCYYHSKFSMMIWSVKFGRYVLMCACRGVWFIISEVGQGQGSFVHFGVPWRNARAPEAGRP